MASSLDHLDLPQAGGSSGLARHRHEFGESCRDREQFAQSAIRSIREIIDDHGRPERRLHGHDPDLLFRARVRKYGGSAVKESLRRADCHTLVAVPDERFPWIVRAGDKGLTRLQRDIEASVSKKRSYVDMIEEFSIMDPSEKFGKLLRENPLGEAESDYVVVDILKKSGDDGSDLRDDTLGLIRDLAAGHGFHVSDEFVSENVCQALVMANRELLRELSLVDYVRLIDRRPEFQLAQAIKAQALVDLAPHAVPAGGIRAAGSLEHVQYGPCPNVPL